MPQMNPMLWAMMSPLILLTMIILMSNIYFTKNPQPLKIINNKNKNNNFMYKW